MSVHAMARAFDLDLRPTELLVLLAMVDHADKEGKNIFPAMALICQKTGLSEDTITRSRKKLVKAGILEVAAWRPGRSTIYRMNLMAGKLRNPPQIAEGLISEPTANCGGSNPPQIAETPQGADRPPRTVPPHNHKEPSKRVPPTLAPAPNPEHHKFVTLYCDAWKQQNGSDYAFQGGADGSSLKRLLKATGATAEQLMAIVLEAWSKSGKNYWSCEYQTGTIAKFCAAYNQIKIELKNGHENRSTSYQGVDRAAGTWNERKLGEVSQYKNLGRVGQVGKV